MAKVESEATKKSRLEALRLQMLKLANLDDLNRIPEIKPKKERQCKHCGTTGPCTPKNFPCSGCGKNLAGSPRVDTGLFDESQY